MNKIYIVSKEIGTQGAINLHAFEDKEEARKFAINYIYNYSTLEDQQSGIQKDEYDCFDLYGLFTSKYGYLTLKVSEINFSYKDK